MAVGDSGLAWEKREVDEEEKKLRFRTQQLLHSILIRHAQKATG